jgi:excisionase family DNA binding protein
MQNEELLKTIDDLQSAIRSIERIAAKYKQTVPASDRALLTQRQAADYLGIGGTTLKQLVADASVPIRKYQVSAKCWRFRRDELDQYVASLRSRTAAERVAAARFGAQT